MFLSKTMLNKEHPMTQNQRVVSLNHTFNVDLASEYGIEEAIMIHHFQFWILANKRAGKNLYEERTWTYQTLDEIAAHFPYWDRSKVFEIIERLCTGKSRRSKKTDLDFEPVLLKGNFNKTKFDKTTWYAFVNEKMFAVLANAKISIGKCQNDDWQMPTPIPDTKTYTETPVCSGDEDVPSAKKEEPINLKEKWEHKKTITYKSGNSLVNVAVCDIIEPYKAEDKELINKSLEEIDNYKSRISDPHKLFHKILQMKKKEKGSSDKKNKRTETSGKKEPAEPAKLRPTAADLGFFTKGTNGK